jgi:xylose dehydrogenase (NAD/NADP)
MAERVKWGILGNANIARACVIPAICKSGNGTAYALATRSLERATELVSRYGIQQVYASYDALLADPDVEAVYVPLPNHLHHPWTLGALEAGKHVLCEKPLACNARQAEEMAGVAEASGLLLMEAFMYRFHPRSRLIKQMVQDGVIGTPRLVRSAFTYVMDEQSMTSEDNPRLRPETGGGALLDIGCYSVSVARWMMGAEPTHVQGQATYHRTGVDVHFVGTLRFPQGGLATLETSFISALQQTYTIVGSEGAIELPHDAFVPWDKDAAYTIRKVDQEEGSRHTVPGADEYQLMVEHFCDAVLGKASLAVEPEESVRNMQVLDALAQSARIGRTVLLRQPGAREPESSPDTPNPSSAL